MAQTLSLNLLSASSQYASIADGSQSGLDITGDMTIEMWVRLTTHADANLAGKWNSTGNQRSFIFQYSASTGLYFAISTDGSAATDGSIAQTLSTKKWYHVAVAYDASAGTAEVYLNGVSLGTISSLATSIFNSSANFEVGHFQSSGTYCNGKIKDVRVWNTLRTDQEIADNFNVIQTGAESGLVSNWLFEGDYTDQAGNNDLTASGSPVFHPDVPLIPGDFLSQAKITIDNTKVPGSTNFTDIPILFADGNFISDVYTTAKGIEDYSIDFESGSSQSASIADGSQTGLDLSGNFTIEFWIKMESSAATQRPISKYNTTGNQRAWQVEIQSNNKFGISVSSDGSTTAGQFLEFETTSSTIPDNIWTHVAITFTIATETCLIYINGIPVAVSLVAGSGLGASLHNSTADVIVSGRNDGGYMDGTLKDLRVWNTVRTQLEICQNMTKSLVGNESGLVAEWKFNNSALDTTANNNDLTLNNSPVYVTDTPNGGADIRFTSDIDGANELACEFVKWDKGSETSEVWVKVPTLDYNDDTVIYVWYENDSANKRDPDDGFGSQNVWPSDMKAVYHLQDSFKDSTVNANHMSGVNSPTFDTGKIKKGADFELSSSQQANITDAAQTGLDITGNVTLLIWAKFESSGGARQGLISKYDDAQRSYGLSITSTNLQSHFNGATEFEPSDAWSRSNGTWYYLGVTYNAAGGSAQHYVDGATLGSAHTGGPTSLSNTSAALRLAYILESWYNDGMFDEAWVIAAERSADYIATLYNNQSAPSTFAAGSTLSNNYSQQLDETVILVETTTKQPGKVLGEVVTLVDTQIKDISKVLGEVATLVDTYDTSYIFATSLNEILTLVDTEENKITGKTLFEVITLVDTAYKSVEKSLAEVVTLVDTIDNLKLYGRDFTDAITLVDTVTKQAGKSIAEIVTLVDTIANAKQYSRTFDEVATLVDDVLLTAGKVLNDAVTLVDTLAKVGTFGRALSETVTLTERFQGLLNGQNIAWIRKYLNQAGTFIKKYLEIP